ncbi:arylsulfatase [Rubrivirga marina]|uniref:Sulfatase N-terminal domain-containing protein n=1 Tax=Rubrivirga marina TaxID=1196024 RepID=A0A271IYX2_9BACT|nr:arylsulfatase [Rubrivirga marina]PAP76004.1 hypothetical protein BSZ37_05885 [Rubrivirga marina]
MPIAPPARAALCLLAMGLVLAGAVRGQETRPNVLLVMTDDQGWGDVRSHGNPLLDTPVMDRLAREGARFERFYVSPVCAPSRASLLTGRYSLRTGTQWVTYGLETMRPEEVTIAEVFGAAGYATGLFGKWHNGSHYPSDPLGQGFDTFVGFSAGHWNNYVDAPLVANGREVETRGFITDVLTDSALAFVERNRDRPFLAYVPYNAPHSPFQVPDAYFDRYKARGFDDRTAAVYGMVENVDDNLGRLLDRIEALGLAERTVVVFLTDNGPNGDRFNGHMRGFKASVHEGGSRVPLFVRWPGRIEAGATVPELAAHIDLLPTLADLAGVPLPAGLVLDGVSLAPALLGTGPAPTGRTLFTHHSRGADLEPYPGAVRTDRWRLVREGAGWELFDMAADPSEAVDVAAHHPDVARRLAAAYDAWFADVTRGLDAPRRIPVGFPEAPVVTLPAVESTQAGGVRYAGESGWANDWLTGWGADGDRAAWALDVVEAGVYRVVLDVTAPAPGVRLRVASGAATTEAVVDRAFDPPFLPSPDRVPRGEVYAKPWMPLDAGTLRLGAGPARLAVDLVAAPGPDALDLHAVTLHRVR